MEKYIAMILICLQLLGGGATAEVRQENAHTPTLLVEPVTQYENPLNGEILEQPYTGRIFMSTISNVYEAIPHAGLNQADVVMEMFVNNSVIRCLALFSNIQEVKAFGGVRSTRLMFNQLTDMYDAVLLHSGGSGQVLKDVANRGFDHFNIEEWNARNAKTSYRATGYGRLYENSLFGIGENVVAYAQTKGFRTTQPEGKTYGFRFTDEGTPNGESANTVSITFKFGESRKDTTMKYNSQTDQYEFHQYNRKMQDQITGETECFTNVLVANADIYLNGRYQMANFTSGGDGYFACGGKIVPITWSCANEKSPMEFFNADGTPLQLERGNTYIAIAPKGSDITWS